MISNTLRLLLALSLLVAWTACGEEKAEELKTFKKQDSKTMKEEGTALNEEEKQRRQKSAEELKAQAAATQRLSRAANHLNKAEDTFDIAEALAEFEAEGAAAILYADRIEKFIDHEDAEVRSLSVKTMAAIMGEKARPMLMRILNNADEDDSVRIAAIAGWKSAGLKQSGPVEALLDDIDPGVQRAALSYLLVDKPSNTRLEFIRSKVVELEGPAAKLGIQWLAKRRDQVTDLGGLVVEMLDHQDPRVRAMTISLAGDASLKNLRVAKKLVTILGDDPSLVVRTETQKLLTAWAGAKTPPAYDPEADDDALLAAAEKWEGWLSTNASLFSQD